MKNFKKHFKIITFTRVSATILFMISTVLGCARSNQFTKDENYTQEGQSGYYNQPEGEAKSPIGKVESMGQPKKRVFVFDFWNDTPITYGELGRFAADELRRSLFNSQRLIVPQDLKTEFSTVDFVQGEKIRVSQLIREGRRLGISVLVIGRITKIIIRQRGDEVGVFRQKQSMSAVEVEMKVFDVNAGREILAVARSGESTNNAVISMDDSNQESPEYRAELSRFALRQAVAPLAGNILKTVEKMAWQGHVAKVQGQKVYINAGKASGLVSGDILKVLTPGDEVYDPATGAYLGRSQGQLKGTLEVRDFIGPDGALSEVHTGGNFQIGDSVQLY